MKKISSDEALILIVDDNINNIKVVLNLLRENNYKTAFATNGPEALEFISRKRPDLILLDIMMPNMDGYEVCKRLKENPMTSEIPVIFLTALNNIDDMVKGFKVGGVDFISKPFHQEELLVRVSNHVSLIKSKNVIMEQNEQLKKLNQEKNDMLSIVAHDLKNPINTIIGFSKLCEKNCDSFPLDEIISFVKDIRISAESMFEIVNDLLDMNAIEEGRLNFNFNEFDIKKVISNKIDYFERAAKEKNIELIFQENGSVPKVYADLMRADQIIGNLISNAIKFSPFDKSVSVTCDYKNNNGKLEISIEDEGPGIMEEEKVKLFKKFSRLSSQPTGTETSCGLGLALSKKLADKMNCDIDVISEYGKGSVFKLHLPVA